MYIYYNEYDGLREYCMCERVNEEYMRTLIKEKSVCFFDMVMMGLLIVGIVVFCIGCVQNMN